MVGRVATFAHSSKLLSLAMQTQSRLAEKQVQEASGLISSTYGGLGADAGSVVNLEVSLTRAQSYLSSAQTALSRVEMMYSAVGGISDILTSIRSSVNGVITEDQLSDLQALAASYLEDISSLLNTRYEGRYLFGGGMTSSAPVDTGSYVVTDLDTADTSYYSGDSVIQSVRISADRELSYGVTGDNAAFEETLRVLSYLANAADLTVAGLPEISEALVSSQDKVIAVQSTLSIKAASLETAIAREEDYITAISETINSKKSVDVVALAAEISTMETQLQASYSIIGKLSNFSLLDYLR